MSGGGRGWLDDEPGETWAHAAAAVFLPPLAVALAASPLALAFWLVAAAVPCLA